MTWNPYESLPPAPTFTLTSPSFKDGEHMPLPQASGLLGAGGQDQSPELTWSGFDPQTKGFVLTMLDPDAPTVTGIWHWCVVNIPGSVTRLAAGAGDEKSSLLPDGAYQIRNDLGRASFLGAAPPPGHGPHRYIYCVIALDVESLDLEPEATPPTINFACLDHTLGRAFLTGIYER